MPLIKENKHVIRKAERTASIAGAEAARILRVSEQMDDILKGGNPDANGLNATQLGKVDDAVQAQYDIYSASATAIDTIRASDVPVDENGDVYVTMPDLSAMNPPEARLALEALGVDRVRVERITDDAPAGTILSQSPLAGVEFTRTTRVNITASNGPAE